MRAAFFYSGQFLFGVLLAMACSSSGGGGSAGGLGAATGTGATGTGATGNTGGGATSGTGGLAMGGEGGSAGGSGAGGDGGSAAGGFGGSSSGGDSGLPDVTFNYDAGPEPDKDACASVTTAAQNPPVDVIWIVDQSCSMTEEIDQIRTNINTNFANIIAASGLDYRVTMFSNANYSTRPVCVLPPLGAATCGQNKPPTFYQVNVTVLSTDSFSKFMTTTNWNNIKANLRPEAFKAFIEVTDDQSGVTAAVFDAFLLTGAGAGYFGTPTDRRYVFHSIIGVDKQYAPTQPKVTTKCSSAINAGPQYQDLSILTGGLRYPVCLTDYSAVFQAIAQNIIGKVACDLVLPTTDAGIIDPSKVKVEYTSGGGSTTQFTQVANAGACAGDGFYYDNPASPTKATLCPQSCTTVKNDPAAKLELLLGCLGS